MFNVKHQQSNILDSLWLTARLRRPAETPAATRLRRYSASSPRPAEDRAGGDVER